MARDIEEFLRRAAERRKQQLKQKQQRPAAPPQRPATPPLPSAQPAKRLVIADDEVEIVRPLAQREIDMRDESVAEHVARHINTSELVEHASHLADRIEQTDERLEARLHQKFDHKLGKLNAKPTVQDDVVPSVKTTESSQLANDLFKMFQSPDSVRKAILISEILNRPSFDQD